MKRWVFTIVCLFAGVGVCCSTPVREKAGAPSADAGKPAIVLNLGLMPAINSIPFIMAEHMGYFRDEGITVNLIMFQSQFYRETALQTHQIDGSVSDLINAVNAWRSGFPAKVTSLTQGDFALLTSAASGIQTMKAWNDYNGPVKTGLLKDSIVYYVTEKMLASAGGDKGKIDLVSTLHLPSRLEMLLSGDLDAGCFPEPLATAGELQGAFRLLDTDVLPFTPGVFIFTEKAIVEKAEAIAAMYRAHDKAAAFLNDWGRDYIDVIIEKGNFPHALKGRFLLPEFYKARNFTADEFEDVTVWMMEKGLISGVPAFRDVINTAFTH